MLRFTEYSPHLGSRLAQNALLEPEDDISRLPREVGKFGLLSVIDDHYRSFEKITACQEEGRCYYETIVILPSHELLKVIIPDEPWLDHRLRLTLEIETAS